MPPAVAGYYAVLAVLLFSLKMDFVLTNSADPDEMLHDAAFQQGLRFLPKNPFRGFQSTKG